VQRPIFNLFLILLFPFTCFSQGFINKSKTQVRKILERQIKLNDTLNIDLIESDSTIVYSIRDPKLQPMEFIYHFDNKKKCNTETIVAYCDSCYTKFLNNVLAKEKYGWIRLNGNQYASKYSERLLLELLTKDSGFSFRLVRTNWTKTLYRMLLEGQ
jgi:hypothetical protein